MARRHAVSAAEESRGAAYRPGGAAHQQAAPLGDHGKPAFDEDKAPLGADLTPENVDQLPSETKVNLGDDLLFGHTGRRLRRGLTRAARPAEGLRWGAVA